MTAHGLASCCVLVIACGIVWRLTQAVQWILNGRRS